MISGVVEDADVGSDLATVRIQATDLPIMKLGKSSTVRPGNLILLRNIPNFYILFPLLDILEVSEDRMPFCLN